MVQGLQLDLAKAEISKIIHTLGALGCHRCGSLGVAGRIGALRHTGRPGPTVAAVAAATVTAAVAVAVAVLGTAAAAIAAIAVAAGAASVAGAAAAGTALAVVFCASRWDRMPGIWK